MSVQLNSFFRDRWCNILIYFIAYLFLIVAIEGFYSATGQIVLPLIGILALLCIIRIVMLWIRPAVLQKEGGKRGKPTIWQKIEQGAVDSYARFICYLILLTIVLGPAFKGKWVMYVFIVLAGIAALVQLLVKKRE